MYLLASNPSYSCILRVNLAIAYRTRTTSENRDVAYINIRANTTPQSTEWKKAIASYDTGTQCNVISRRLVEEMLDVRIVDDANPPVAEGEVLGSSTKLHGYAELEWSTESRTDRQISRFYVTKDPHVPFDIVLAPKLGEKIADLQGSRTHSQDRLDAKDPHSSLRRKGRRRLLCL